VNTANRVLWIVVGSVLAVAGAVGILASQGRLPGVDAHRVLLSPNAGHTWHRFGAWAPTLAVVAGLVLIVLGWLLLRAELRVHPKPALPDMHLRGPDPAGYPGRTNLETAVLARAMSRDLRSAPQISDAHVRITSGRDRPEVSLRLRVNQGADLNLVSDHVSHALSRLAATMPGEPAIDQVLVSTVGDAARRRVV
jgi:hypothetical protein